MNFSCPTSHEGVTFSAASLMWAISALLNSSTGWSLYIPTCCLGSVGQNLSLDGRMKLDKHSHCLQGQFFYANICFLNLAMVGLGEAIISIGGIRSRRCCLVLFRFPVSGSIKPVSLQHYRERKPFPSFL